VVGERAIEADVKGAARSRRRLAATIALVFACALVAVLRLHECTLLPVDTGDIVRHLLYGRAVAVHGFAAAAEPLTAFAPDWQEVAWAAFPYSYPPVTLAFFALVAALLPSVFFAKLALTVLEAVNASLIARLTGSRWLGVLYWASPMSIWWVSREGQFEPLQAFFSLLATLFALLAAPFLCGLAIALAIAVKMTAAALLPWLAVRLWQSGRRACAWAAAGFIVGCLPLLAAQVAYGGVSNVLRFGRLLVYNPYYWNPFADMFAWNPPWQVALDEVASYAMLVVLLVLAMRSGARLSWLAAIVFLVFCKLHSNVQFWYFLLLPSFLVTIPDRRWRFALIALCPLLDLRGSFEVLLGPVGPNRFHGLPSAFDRYPVP